MNFLKQYSIGGLLLFAVILLAAGWGLVTGLQKLFPKKVNQSQISTKAVSGLTPLAYDKNSNAPFREIPQLNEAVTVSSPEIRGGIMAWNGFLAGTYGVGGLTTSKGSIAEELGLNIKLSNQNDCGLQGEGLYTFAKQLHDGNPSPTDGYTFINWMGDGVPNYLSGLNDRLTKDFGPEYVAKVISFTGGSFGEDKWLLKKKYEKDARGSLTITVPGDGDWNISIIKSQIMGWPVNNVLGTYDRDKVNFVAAANNNFMESANAYNLGTKYTLKLIQNGKYLNKDTTLTASGVSSWFPADLSVVQNKGGLVTVASTADYSGQMACAIIVINKWAKDNPTLVEKMIEMFARSGDQIKSHEESLKFATQAAELVFADKDRNWEDWYKAYKSYELTDEDGNVVKIGGSRTFNLADVANYTGVNGSADSYKKIYNTFGSIVHEAFPELVSEVCPYENATDWSYLKAVYNRLKDKAGTVSKVDFTKASKSEVLGDASYNIQFETGSAVLKPESYKILDQIDGQLSTIEQSFVEISGHTDNTGDPSKNITLSKQRAESVKAYLLKKDPDYEVRIKTEGFGQNKPLNPDENQDDLVVRSKNRRVEIKFIRAKQ